MDLLHHWGLIARLFGVLGTNLVLSGDNAVVIAMAAHRLRGSMRRKAIIWGAAGAVGLRLVFALLIAMLIAIPFLRAVGGVVLFWIAWRLVREDAGASAGEVKAGEGVWDAVKIIVVADAAMSLDNVIALVGVSGGNLWILGAGLVLTVPPVIWGSSLLSVLLDRWPWLAYAGAALLAWIALEMILQDPALRDLLPDLSALVEAAVKLIGTLAFVAATWWAQRARFAR
ncbi:MAG: TerC family protein [Actinomycetota bacterium]